MINVQSFIKDDSIIIFFDNEGIDEMIKPPEIDKN